MADALAIIGVIGVAGQIIQLIARHGLDWKDAPAETAKCLEDINLLKAMLEDTDTDALATLSTEWRAATAASMSACKEELARLYRELTRRTVGHRVGWKRLKGAFGAKKTREAVEDLHRRFQAINDSVSRDALAVVTKGVTELREAQQQTVLDKDTEQILDWISSADYDSIHSDFIGRRQEGTGKWLLESEEYKQWLDGSKKALFCPGIPGAGKTMATAIVVDDLLERFRGNHNVGIAFIYCNFRRQGDQKPEHLLASFLKQLCQRRASLPKGVRDLFDECESRKRRPRLDELAAALKDIIPKFSRAFLIIDALDECGMEGGSRSKLLAEYTSLRDLVGANIFATSRHIDDIKQKFVGSPSLEILAQPEDIRRYLADKIPHLASFVADNAQLQEEIKTAIVNAVEGMFLLAKLHLDSLQGQRSPKQIRLISNKFRKGSDAYYYAYEDAMR
ncbi:hypothetical protein F5X68DRAFT_272237 [Plectosphaerella plurivora]|uniref:Nephrocystin 3-like N-terminal domain-containing protein n=1 Tax=Plectosphaerella plurivora TaxID=936078 RepID=A0A9P8VNL9_9PEZI|nr:hypothetical protein F5X68DRAFT_272237 [Plectosphaerella plurivora]